MTKNEKASRLKELEEKIYTWKCNDRLWCYGDKEVEAVLKERDELFLDLNPGHVRWEDNWPELDKERSIKEQERAIQLAQAELEHMKTKEVL